MNKIYYPRLKSLVGVCAVALTTCFLLNSKSVQAQPNISSVTPTSGIPLVGAVTITGTGFNATPANNQVHFGGDTAIITAGSTTTLTMLVPIGAQYNNVNVLNRTTRLSGDSRAQFLPTFFNTCFVPATFNFKPKVDVTLPASAFPYNLAVGDLNGDGKPDMVTANYNTGNISGFANSTVGTVTTPTFGAAVSFTTFTNPNNVKLADLDGDGRLDFIVSETGGGGRVSIVRNGTAGPGGPITFLAAVRHCITTGKASEAAIADFDGDGKPDIATVVTGTTSGADSVKVFRNLIAAPLGATGFTGTSFGYTSPSSVSTGANSNPVSIFANDFDGDGKVDLVIVNQFTYGLVGTPTVSVLRNITNFTGLPATPGIITFAAPVDFPVPTGLVPNQVIVADINGDGKSDIIFTSSDFYPSGSGTNNIVSVMQNNASSGAITSGSFAARVDFTVPNVATTSSFVVGLQAGDLDGDGKVDLAVAANGTGNVVMFRNTSSTTIDATAFSVNATYATGTGASAPIGVAMGDMDGDSKTDVLVANSSAVTAGNNSISIFRNYPLPISDTITGHTHLCAPDIDTFKNTVAGGIWSVTNTTLATINSSNGAVYPLAAGVDTVVYTIVCNGDSAVTSKAFTVNLYPSVSPIVGTVTTLCTTNSMTLTDATPLGTWVSSLPGVANVVGGTVTGISAGSATISYQLTNTCGTTTVTYGPVTVNTSPAAITGTMAICTGAHTSLFDATGSGTWSTSAPPTTATISATGQVGGVSPGTANITYTLGSCYSTAVVTISSTPIINPISGTVTTLCTGSQATLTETTTGGSWTSSNNSFATVVNGVVTAVAAGVVNITYTVTTGCGTGFVTYGPITVNTSPAVITGTTSVCVSSTVSLFDATGSGSWSATPAGLVNISPTGGVTGLSGGVASISYTMTGGCYSTTNFTVNTAPTVNAITGLSSNVCTGAITTLTETTTGGSWSSSNNLFATVTIGGLVTGVAAGTVNISYSKTNGCGTTYQLYPMTVNVTPAAITGTFIVCENATVSLFNTTGSGTWSATPSGIVNVSPTGAVTGVAGGVANISYTTTGGCYATAPVTVNAAPQPITGGNSVCQGSNVTLTDISGGGTWSSLNPTIAPINSSTGMVTGLASGSATIIYTFTSNSCSTSLPFTVYALPNPIGGPTSVCVGSSITVTETTPFGTWSTATVIPAIATIDANTGMVTGLSTGTAIISYTVTSTTCAIGSMVTVNPLPGVISGPSAVCLGSFITLSDAPGGGTWFSTNTINAPISPSGVVTGGALGTAIISYTIPSTGCYATKNMTVHPLPLPITGLATICSATDITLSSGTPGGTWSSGTPTIATVINASTGDFRGVAGGAALVTYTAPVTGCIDTAILQVLQSPAPITGPSYVCLGFTVPLSSDSTGGVWISSDTFTVKIDSATGVAHGVATGVVTIVYAQGTAGCTAIRSLTVNPLVTPLVSITASPSITVCAGTPVTFTANTINGGTTPIYQWRLNNGPVLSGSSSYFYTPSNNDSVKLTLISNAICPVPAIVKDTVVMTVNPLLTPVINLGTGMGDTVCLGVPVTISPNPINAGAAPTYQWKVNFIPVGPGSSFTYVPANGDIITAIVHSNATCRLVDTATDTMHLTVSPFVNPAVTLIGSDTTCEGYPTVFYASPVNGGWSPTYAWTITGLPTSTGSGVAFSATTGNTVSVTMTSDFPCLLAPTATSSTHTIMVLPVDMPAITISISPGYIVAPGTPVTFTANPVNPGLSPTYQWKKNGATITGATNAVYSTATVANADVFSCYFTNNDLCNGITVFASQSVQVGDNVGIKDADITASNVSIVPNPNTGSFNISGTLGINSNEDIAVIVTNMLGQVVYRTTGAASNGNIDMQVLLNNNLSNGMYLLNIQSEHCSKVIHFEVGR